MAAEKKDARKPAPNIEVDYLSDGDHRAEISAAYDEHYPDYVHAWVSSLSVPKYLKRKQQEVVMDEDNEPLEDGQGDMLVRIPREGHDARRKKRQDLSLERAERVVSEYGDQDIELVAAPKKVKQKKKRKVDNG